MYATVRTYAGNTDLADVLVQNEDAVRNLISGIDGFKAYYLVRADGGAVSITVYDDQAGAEESNRVAADWVRENAAEAAGSPPQISAGEVVISA